MLRDEIAPVIQTRQIVPANGNIDPGRLAGEETRGVEFAGRLEDVYWCNLHLRTASRVSIHLGEFFTTSFSDLRKKASRLPWELFLRPGNPIRIHVSCHKSKLYHSDAVAERILSAISDHFYHRGAISLHQHSGGQLILVRLSHDLCSINIDSSGEMLHKRGYRQAIAKAPLRETLAAGMILLSGWNNTAPLIDPFCGSGTIPVEAGLFAQGIPPGIVRDFQFQHWPIFDPYLWDLTVKAAKKNITGNVCLLAGYDRDAGAIRMAKENASRAGQLDRIDFRCQAISSLEAPCHTGWIVTNPPYGRRIQSNRDLRDLYARFGTVLKKYFKGWKGAILCNDFRLIANLGLGVPENVIKLIHGGIPVNLNMFNI